MDHEKRARRRGPRALDDHPPATMMLAGTALVSATAAAVLADQSAKAMMGRRRRVGGAPVAWGSPGFTWVRNPRGSVIGLSLAWTVVVWIGAAAGAAVVVTLTPSMGIVGAVGLGLALGGAASNLGDRLARGAVVDVIALWSWPPFNLADAAMVIGWALLTGSLV